MSELRKDLISGRWVIIATERSKRPDDFRPPAPVAAAAEAAGFCPFCEGNEAKTPPEVFALRAAGTAPDSPGWTVRVVPNKFPALTPGPPPPRASQGVFQSMEGRGVHEVIIENPVHGLDLADLPVAHIRDVLRVFQMRIRAIEGQLHYQYVQVFKNKGKEAGASLSHPHSQIVATPIVPKRVKEEIYGADRLFRTFKECAFCRILREEEALGARIIARTGHFTALAPYASRFPFEMTVLPRRHSAFFVEAREDELEALAAILKDVLTRLKVTVGDPPFNMVLHQAPNQWLSARHWPELAERSHWHIEIIPILTKVAGFEWGTGFYINPVPPETGAQFLRQA
ncbi:MAG TPA: galactose-1-phosphate uridylyltransferase [Candidatus Aminicenantes bacterium]|nr:galactose-1-phosphate uridylyltransferase [Candidatus Aminicenantes bacterium]HRY65190.1 galactose-1-phosphate uridylyltransferase [Candidatus Aminicenantes bacterium]HRZ72342.1 galactose-1-phosphate uridylyltransferase [Candidatus Aminicenantes bacterium]